MTTSEELQIALSTSDNPERLVCTELCYRRQTNPHDATTRSALYKINQIKFEEQVENLMILLGDKYSDKNTSLPTNEEVINVLNGTEVSIDVQEPELVINDMVVFIPKKKSGWQLGFISQVLEDGNICSESLKGRKDGISWKRGGEDTTISEDQIISVKPTGDWDFANTRIPDFKLLKDCKYATMRAIQ